MTTVHTSVDSPQIMQICGIITSFFSVSGSIPSEQLIPVQIGLIETTTHASVDSPQIMLICGIITSFSESRKHSIRTAYPRATRVNIDYVILEKTGCSYL